MRYSRSQPKRRCDGRSSCGAMRNCEDVSLFVSGCAIVDLIHGFAVCIFTLVSDGHSPETNQTSPEASRHEASFFYHPNPTQLAPIWTPRTFEQTQNEKLLHECCMWYIIILGILRGPRQAQATSHPALLVITSCPPVRTAAPEQRKTGRI